MQRNLEQTTEGSAAFHSNGHSYYLVYQPVGINDWSIIGIVQADAVNSADQRILPPYAGNDLCLGRLSSSPASATCHIPYQFETAAPESNAKH